MAVERKLNFYEIAAQRGNLTSSRVGSGIEVCSCVTDRDIFEGAVSSDGTKCPIGISIKRFLEAKGMEVISVACQLDLITVVTKHELIRLVPDRESYQFMIDYDYDPLAAKGFGYTLQGTIGPKSGC